AFIGSCRIASTLISCRSLLQSPRRDRRVVIEQSDTHECLARFIKITALELDIARQETRLSVHLSLRLKHHDLLGDLLRVVWFMSSDLHLTKLRQTFAFSARSVGDFKYLANPGFGLFDFFFLVA